MNPLSILPCRFHCVWMFLVAVLSVHDAASQSVARVESVLVKQPSGDHQVIPPPPDTRTAPTPATVSGSAPFTLEAGAALRSGGEAGTVLLLDTSGSARMGAETSIRVPDEKTTTHSLEQLGGTLYFNIDADELKKTRKSEFRLKTPVALLAVKGTHFFAHCDGGADRIGVHEGVVMVHEPVSRKTITLTAGNAVEVQSGSMGEPRPLSADELSEQTNYDGLESQTLPVQVFREDGPPAPAETPAAVWGKLLLRDATTPPGQPALQDRDPEVNSSGVLRLTWPGLPPLREPATFWSSGQIRIPDLAASSPLKPIALRASVRATGCSEIILGMGNPDGSETFAGQQIRQTSWPSDGAWVPCFVDVPAGTDGLRLSLRALPDASQQMRTPGRIFNVGFIEIKDISIVLAPND